MITLVYKPLLFCLCFLACRKSTTTAANPVKLKPSECATVQRAAGAVKVCLDSLNDSRCPANVNCVWEGYAAIKLTVSSGSNTHSFHLSTLNRHGFPPTDTTVAAHHFHLKSVQPYPGTSTTVSPYVELAVD